MRVVVPFDARDPKTRLGPVLDPAERREFALAMCRDVLEALRAAGTEPEVLANAPVDVDAPVTVDERDLTAAVNGVLAETDAGDGVAVVMADLALATPATVERLLAPRGEADVTIAPGRGGGTNALVVGHPAFRVDYHGASVRDHRRAAADLDAVVREVDSFRLATDVDEPSDLAEVLLHGDGRSRDWLSRAGFELAVDDGRVGVTRARAD
ncbi:MAG: 2-phospho-L-lactate guanylyltransferase [Haloarculaceae archaeon]